jgi:neutral ceramidase
MRNAMLVSTAALVLVAFLAPQCLAVDWLAGVAKVKITPKVPMPMAGYASRGASLANGTLNELWAKAIVLRAPDSKPGVLITMDLCGIDRELSLRIKASIAAAAGIEIPNIVLSVSHTHSGPVVAGNLRPMHYAIYDQKGRELVDRYAADLVELTTECVVRAKANMRASRLAYGSGTATFAVNRRNNSEQDVAKLREAGNLIGPVDHDVPVLRVTRGEEVAAIIFGYACHCTTLSGMQWSSDYAGFAQDEIEALHPDCVAMFWAGCGADQNPLPRRTLALAKDYGHQLADAVEQVLNGELRPLTATLAMSYQEIQVPFSPIPTQEQLAADALADNVYVASRAQYLLKKLDEGPLATTYPYPIATWKLGGQVEWVSLGGEVVVDFAHAIKSKATAEQTRWVMAYAHDVMAYIPSRRVLAEGGYEGGGAMVYYGLPAPWAPEIEGLILAEVDRQHNQPGEPQSR